MVVSKRHLSTRQVLHRPLVGRLPGAGGGRDRGGR